MSNQLNWYSVQNDIDARCQMCRDAENDETLNPSRSGQWSHRTGTRDTLRATTMTDVIIC